MQSADKARVYVDQWVERHADIIFQRQRAQIDTAKLLVTFSTAVAATLVAATLQIGKPTNWDKAAAAMLGVSALLALAVLSKDRFTEVDAVELRCRQIERGWGPEKTIKKIREATLTSSAINEDVVITTQNLMWVQLAAAALCGLFAIVAFFVGGS